MRIRILESAVADLAAGKDFYDRQEIGACRFLARSACSIPFQLLRPAFSRLSLGAHDTRLYVSHESSMITDNGNGLH